MIFEENQFSRVSHLRQPIIYIDFNDIVANIQNYEGTNAFNFIKKTNSHDLVHSLANFTISQLAFQFYLLDDTEMAFIKTDDYVYWLSGLFTQTNLEELSVIIKGDGDDVLPLEKDDLLLSHSWPFMYGIREVYSNVGNLAESRYPSSIHTAFKR